MSDAELIAYRELLKKEKAEWDKRQANVDDEEKIPYPIKDIDTFEPIWSYLARLETNPST